MTVEPDAVASSELAALLLSEAAAGIEAAAPAMNGWIRVDRVVVRVGSRADTDEVDWEAEMSLVPDDEPGEPPSSTTGSARVPIDGPVPPAVATLDVTAIDGVTNRWRARLARESITTVGELATIDASRLQELATAHGRGVRTLVGRARSCRVAIPTPGRAASIGIGKLLELPLDEVRALIGGDDGTAAILAAASNLSAALRPEVLDGIRAGDLAAVAGSS